MLYFKALLNGLDDMPKADPAIRAALASEAAQKGWPAMHAELARIDPVTSARLEVNDSQRIARALEVFRVSGQTMASFHGKSAMKNIASQADLKRVNIFISLEPELRSWLHERIAQRFDAMLAAGLVGEVKALRARGDLTADLPSMRCVGYRQIWELLDQQEACGMGGNLPMNELRDKGICATRQLAKRQLTWLRSLPDRHVVACDNAQVVQQVLSIVSSKV